jgi:hypothetical protein
MMRRGAERAPDPDSGQVIHGDVSLIANRPWTHAFFWLVLLAALGVDVVTFYQVLVLVLDVPEWMVWLAVTGFVSVALTLAHYAGVQAKQGLSPRNVLGSVTAAWIFAGIWAALGATAFVVRYIISQPTSAGTSTFIVEGSAQATVADSADLTSQHLSALLFLVLYVATGAVAALGGFFRPDPMARQYGRALERRAGAARRHANSSFRVSQVQQTVDSIARARTRREEAWVHAQQQCTAAAERLKREARLLISTARRETSEPDPGPQDGPAATEGTRT